MAFLLYCQHDNTNVWHFYKRWWQCPIFYVSILIWFYQWHRGIQYGNAILPYCGMPLWRLGGLISTKGDSYNGETSSSYTFGKKGCYTPIEDNKTNVDRTFVFPLGWNWHDMDPWLFPNEIRHYLGQTFNARSSGVVELRNHSIGGRSPKSIFTLWQLWINICIFFQKFFWLFEQCPVQPLWVLGMRCLHLAVRALSKVLLLPVWVWIVLPSTAYSKGMLPLDLWCQASLQGLPERQHLGKTVHCWGWSDRIVSWVLGPWRRGSEICTEWGLVAQRFITDSCPVVTGHIDPQRSPCWLPTTVVSAWSGRRGGGTWQWPTGSMSSSVMSRDSNFTR